MTPDHAQLVQQTRCWLEGMVIGLNLCPFARKPYESGQVRFVVSEAKDEESLLAELQRELEFLQQTPASEVDTTVLIHPYVLQEFIAYNDFLAIVDHYLELAGLEGEFQIASLHPHYQFADTDKDDVGNYSNRAPYPTLHLLREDSVSRAIDSYSRPDKIPERNVRRLQEMGLDAVLELHERCREK